MKNKWLPWIVVGVLIVVAVLFLSYARSLPGFERTAAARVLDEAWQEFKADQDRKEEAGAPAVSGERRARLFDQYVKANQKILEARIPERRAALEARYLDDRGRPYLGGVDSYYWMRHLEDLLERGRIGETRSGEGAVDVLAGHPVDRATSRSVHLGLGWVFVRTARVLFPGAGLADILFFIPVLLYIAIGVLSYAVARRCGADGLGGIFASAVITISPYLSSRMAGEAFDTDIYNVFFPLAILALLQRVFDPAVSRRAQAIAAAAGGFFMAGYAATWQGWWFLFDLIVIAGGLFLINQAESRLEEGRGPDCVGKPAAGLAVFCVVSLLGVAAASGPAAVLEIFLEPWRLSHVLRVAGPASLWPNVYWTVAELGETNAMALIEALGGKLIFFSGLLTMLYFLVREKELRHPGRGFVTLLLVLWTTTVFYAALPAQRFILLLVVPVGLAFGRAVTAVFSRLGDRGWTLRGRRIPARFLVTAALAVFLAGHLERVHKIVFAARPIMNDTWMEVLTEIRERSPQETVVNSWWDFGHWFTGVARRRVAFDGMTQNTPDAYWTAQVLLSDDEAYAARVLRMMNAAGDNAVDLLVNDAGLDVVTGVALVKRCLAQGPEKALSILRSEVSAATAARTHAAIFPKETPPAFFVLSHDMIDKAGPITYIGNWDFVRADLWSRRRQGAVRLVGYIQDRYHLNTSAALARMDEIMALDPKSARPWFSRAEAFRSRSDKSDPWQGLWMFANGLVVDPGKKAAYVTDPSSRGPVKSLFMMEEGAFREFVQEEGSSSMAALVFEDDKTKKCVLTTPELAKSLLSRLYFFRGAGLKCFRPWFEARDEDGRGIYVYEVLNPDARKE